MRTIRSIDQWALQIGEQLMSNGPCRLVHNQSDPWDKSQELIHQKPIREVYWRWWRGDLLSLQTTAWRKLTDPNILEGTKGWSTWHLGACPKWVCLRAPQGSPHFAFSLAPPWHLTQQLVLQEDRFVNLHLLLSLAAPLQRPKPE